MITSTFMIGFSIFVMYALAIGFCIVVLQSEFLKKWYIWFYKILIVLNVIAIIVFMEKCFTVEKICRERYFLVYASATFVTFIIQTILIIVGSVKGRCNKYKVLPRKTYNLKEEWLNKEENIKFCYTQKKKEEGYKGTIVFMHPDYYKCDLNGRVWYLDRRKKILLGHTGKYDEISDYFVRAGYHTVRYDHSDINAEIPIQPVLQRLSNVLQEKNAGKIIVFCAGNINNFMQEIVEGLNPTELICVGVTNQNALEYINSLKERIPVFIGDFGDDPYCSVKNENAIHFENTDFTFCVRGKRKLKKYGRSADNEGITDVAALDVIKEWLTEQNTNYIRV